jgi:hypothetical protein
MVDTFMKRVQTIHCVCVCVCVCVCYPASALHMLGKYSITKLWLQPNNKHLLGNALRILIFFSASNMQHESLLITRWAQLILCRVPCAMLLGCSVG